MTCQEIVSTPVSLRTTDTTYPNHLLLYSIQTHLLPGLLIMPQPDSVASTRPSDGSASASAFQRAYKGRFACET